MKGNKLRWFDHVVMRTNDSDTMIVAVEIDVEREETDKLMDRQNRGRRKNSLQYE